MQKNCFEKLFLCKFRLMFWHSSLLKFCPKKKNYSKIRKRYKQYKFFSTFSSKFCFGHVMCNFGSTDEKISPNVQHFRSKTESALTNIFASRKKKPKSVPLGTQLTVLKFMPYLFAKSSSFFCSKSGID